MKYFIAQYIKRVLDLPALKAIQDAEKIISAWDEQKEWCVTDGCKGICVNAVDTDGDLRGVISIHGSGVSGYVEAMWQFRRDLSDREAEYWYSRSMGKFIYDYEYSIEDAVSA